MGSLLASALDRVQSFLLEPADRAAPRPAPAIDVAAGPRPQVDVVVLGQCAGCGASTIASGLALTLAASGHSLSQRVAVGEEETDEGTAGSAVLVAPDDGQPEIASLVASLLSHRFERLLLVANRVRDANRWSGCADICLPESRVGAALINRGHRPPGALGRSLSQLAAMLQ